MRLVTVGATTLALSLLIAIPALAQQPPKLQPSQERDAHHPAQTQAPERTPRPGAPAPGAPQDGMMHGGGMMHDGMMGGGMPMMGMCPMMGGMMGGGMSGMPMMGMMGGGQMDPKAMARMLQMRGELMKAMGDVLIKHGKELEAAKP